jgi:hypothetical protein
MRIGIQTDLIKLMGFYDCLCSKNNHNVLCSAKHEMLCALLTVCHDTKIKMEQNNEIPKQEKWVKYKMNLHLWS